MGAYSKTPLFKKLGIKDNYSLYVKNAPVEYVTLFQELPPNIHFSKHLRKNIDFIHLFVTSRKQLTSSYLKLYSALKQTGLLWISWPKGSSKIETDLNRDYIRTFVLDNGLVDVKVCSINENWSALKFVYRLKDRN